MTTAGGDRVTGADAWAQNTLRINVGVADLDLAFGEHAFYKAISRSVRAGDV
jgi:hypothetical protein